MELLELLKLLNEQAGKADTQTQLATMSKAIQQIHELMTIDNRFQTITTMLIFGCLLVIAIGYGFQNWKIEKRLKKLELKTGLKKT